MIEVAGRRPPGRTLGEAMAMAEEAVVAASRERGEAAEPELCWSLSFECTRRTFERIASFIASQPTSARCYRMYERPEGRRR